MNTRLVRLSEPVYNLLRKEAQKKSIPMSSLLALAVQAYTGGIPVASPASEDAGIAAVLAGWKDDEDDGHFDEEGLPADI